MTEPWDLGIDFGTSYTVAAVADGSGVTVLDVESSGQTRMPSSVFRTAAGETLVGTAAQHQAAFAPERFEATPKRCIADGDLLLGDDLVPVTDLIAGVFRRAYAEACRQRGATRPRTVRLTHPADWGRGRLELLRAAAATAGIAEPEFVPEPVAAAARIAGTVTRPGDRIAIYDFGGGTFDAAVLRRTDEGFAVAGPPAGRDPLGGEDIDRRIVEHIGSVVGRSDSWTLLTNPPDVSWRRRAIALRAEVQRAKETLSEVTSCQLWLPGLEREFQLTRAELEEIIAADLDACTETLLTALRDASVTPQELQGIYLVGGSSRIPAAADRLWRRLGIVPAVQDNPKSVVAAGAAAWGSAGALPALSRPEITAAVAVERVVRAEGVVPTLVFTLPDDMLEWRSGVTSFQTFDRIDGEPATVRVRDEPARRRDVAQLAERAGRVRAERSAGYAEQDLAAAEVFGRPGLQRAFTMTLRGEPVDMIERYVVAGDRALVLAFPVAHTALADAATPAGWPATNPLGVPLTLPVPAGWTASEELRLGGPRGLQILRAERAALPAEPTEAWRWHRLEALLQQRADAGMAARWAGPVLGSLAGEVVTVRWRDGDTVMLTRLATATESGQGFVLTLTLPIDRQDEVAVFDAIATVRLP